MRNLLILLLCAVPVMAQSPSPSAAPVDDTAAQETALLNKSPGKVFLLTSDEPGQTDGVVIAAFGELGTGPIADAPNTAKTFIGTYGKVLGFFESPPLGGNMKVFRDHQDSNGRILSYCPADAAGAFFLTGMVTFVFKANGDLVAALGGMVPLGAIAPGGMTPAEAVVKAREELKKAFPEERDTITGDGEVAQYLAEVEAPNGDRNTLRIYSVTLKLGDPSIPKRCVLTANGGLVLATQDARAFANSAHVYLKDGSESDTTTKDLDDLVDPGFWPSWKINGTHIKVDPRITPSIERASAWTGWFNDDPIEKYMPNPPFAEENIYYHLQEARKKAIGWGLEDDLKKIDPIFFNHWKAPKCDRFPKDSAARKACECFQTSNGWFDPADRSINFASNNKRLRDRHTGFDGTFITHEYGHLIHSLLSPHYNLGWRNRRGMDDTGAVAEAVADVFSCTVYDTNTFAKWVAQTVQPCEDTSNDAAPDLSRNLEQERLLPAVRGAEIHERGRAFSSAIWKLRKDGTLNPNELVKTTFAAMRISNLPSHFQNIAMGFMAADQMLASTPHTQKIFDLFKHHGILGVIKTSAAP